MNVIDVLAILPFYLSLWEDIGEADLVFLRLLRLVRVLRIFKLGRYTAGSELLMETIRASSSALGLLVFFMSVLTLVFASIIYFCEEGRFKVRDGSSSTQGSAIQLPAPTPPSHPPPANRSRPSSPTARTSARR